jgi:ABC-type Mn2+/Zn2+ transport system ATPase subunit
VLELQRLTRRYGDLVALDGLSFTVAEGQLFGFVGPNGAGKATAMRIILGVLAPDAGEVQWRGQPMTDEMRKHIGYLPEDHGQTFPHDSSLLIAASRLIAVTDGGASFPHLPSGCGHGLDAFVLSVVVVEAAARGDRGNERADDAGRAA